MRRASILLLALLAASPVAAEEPNLGVIEGEIVNDLDEPVLGATVTLWLHDCSVDERVAGIRTGSDGSYTFDALAGGPYCVLVERSGYAGMQQPGIEVEEAEKQVDFTLTRTIDGFYHLLSGEEERRHSYAPKMSSVTLRGTALIAVAPPLPRQVSAQLEQGVDRARECLIRRGVSFTVAWARADVLSLDTGTSWGELPIWRYMVAGEGVIFTKQGKVPELLTCRNGAEGLEWAIPEHADRYLGFPEEDCSRLEGSVGDPSLDCYRMPIDRPAEYERLGAR